MPLALLHPLRGVARGDFCAPIACATSSLRKPAMGIGLKPLAMLLSELLLLPPLLPLLLLETLIRLEMLLLFETIELLLLLLLLRPVLLLLTSCALAELARE